MYVKDLMMTAPVTCNDRPLACQRAGSLTAEAEFEELVARHQRRIFRLALRLLGDPEEAATASQDCFLRAYGALSRCPLDTEGQRRWLSRLAVNLCLDRLRSRKWQWWRRRLGLEKAPASSARLVRSPERELLAREAGDRLGRALNRLSPRQRAVFVLRHYEDCSLEQIARELSLNVGTVKAHLARALTKLRHELKDFYGTPSPGP